MTTPTVIPLSGVMYVCLCVRIQLEEVWQREMKMMLSGKGALELDDFIQSIGMSVASYAAS